MTNKLLLLGYVVYVGGIQVDEAKIKLIQDWLIPANMSELCSFHGLVTLYQRFIKNFSTNAALMIECLKKSKYECNKGAFNSFAILKDRLCAALVLAHSNFVKLFEVDCDASGVEIRVV